MFIRSRWNDVQCLQSIETLRVAVKRIYCRRPTESPCFTQIPEPIIGRLERTI